MPLIEILFLALGLSMDAMTVSLCAGASGFTGTPRPALRISFHFGLFQALMPLMGWLAGRTIEPWVAGIDHWLAFLLLGIVSLRMIRSGLNMEKLESACDPTRGSTLVMLSIATSMDAMAVGFSLAIMGTAIVLPAILIGLVTFSLSLAATLLGKNLNAVFGKRMEIAGGLVLAIIGLRILLTHLFPAGS
jgi:manganese efflux pump family protein